MDHFEIKGDNGFIKITVGQVFGFPNHTSHFGGYDTQSEIEIRSQNYFVKGTLWTSTGKMYDFYRKLGECQKQLKGAVEYINYDRTLELNLTYDDLGHIEVTGHYREHAHLRTQLDFEIKTDQSFLATTLIELQSIADKYGDNMGARNKTGAQQ